jgi:DNA-binding transcriptional LysR family regulator
VPRFLFLEAALAATDLVALVPSQLVRDRAALQAIEPPLEVPGFEILMLWHERAHRDPAHRWLREHVATSVGASDPPAP